MDKADEYMILLKHKLIFGFGISDLFCLRQKKNLDLSPTTYCTLQVSCFGTELLSNFFESFLMCNYHDRKF